MSERVFKDTRLLEALEFIDDEYIASAARYKMKYEAQPAEPPKMTWRTPFKHWRQFVALAACILLLSIASPLVSYIAEVIRDFNAGAGSSLENTSELLTEPETTNGMYDKYILTEEDLAELNEAYFRKNILEDPAYANLDEATINELRKSPCNMFAQSVEIAMSRPSTKPPNGGRYYIGKYGECIVYCHLASEMAFLWPDFLLFVYYNTQFYTLETALQNGWISDSEVRMIQDFCNQIDYYDPKIN